MPLPPLYKYLSVQGAKLTLQNRTFKYAKPSDFNDTEDLTIQSIFPEETEAALGRLSRSFTDIILQHLNDPPTCASPMKEKVAELQRIYRANPGAAEVVKAEIAKEGVHPVFVEDMRARAVAFIAEINEFMQDYRVLCVTSHKELRGYVGWLCGESQGGRVTDRGEPCQGTPNLQLFRPVTYREKRPPVYENTLDFIAHSLFGDQQAQRMAMLNRIIYSKTLDWAHEGEYRLAIPIVGRDERPWNTLLYYPEEITELYLGLAMDNGDLTQIVSMARAINPDIAVFQARREADGKLGFDRVEVNPD